MRFVALAFLVTHSTDAELHRAPRREQKPLEESCHLRVVSQSQRAILELARANRFLSGSTVLLDVSISGQGDLEALHGEQTAVALTLSGERAWLQSDEKKMLQNNIGRWERWIALLEMHCLFELSRPLIAETVLLPRTVAETQEALDAAYAAEAARSGRESSPSSNLRCVDPTNDPDSAVPLFLGRYQNQDMPATLERSEIGQLGLGSCPGVVFFPSSAPLKRRRDLLRSTWLSDYPESTIPLGVEANKTVVSSCVDYFFLTGWPSTDELRVATTKEQDDFKDLVIDCSIQDSIPHYAGLQHKFFRSLQVQQYLFPHAEYFVRASDDTYVNLQRMMSIVDLHVPQMLYLGREVRTQSYSQDWPLYDRYMDTFNYQGLPSVMVGDVVVISTDIVRLLLQSRNIIQHWDHFDDTLGLWLSTASRVRRRSAFRSGEQWIEWREVLGGTAACPDDTLVVAHCPAWKDWQSPASAGLARRWEDDEHDTYLKYMMKTMSAGVRYSGDPCKIDPDSYYRLHEELLSGLVKINWATGRRLHIEPDKELETLHSAPSKTYQGWSGSGNRPDVPIGGVL